MGLPETLNWLILPGTTVPPVLGQDGRQREGGPERLAGTQGMAKICFPPDHTAASSYDFYSSFRIFLDFFYLVQKSRPLHHRTRLGIQP